MNSNAGEYKVINAFYPLSFKASSIGHLGPHSGWTWETQVKKQEKMNSEILMQVYHISKIKYYNIPFPVPKLLYGLHKGTSMSTSMANFEVNIIIMLEKLKVP